ncbi:hypothetical protein BGW41_008117 [Actinomortierella wolfii]|nr:hypothetical protein BGW41_008117 [Actinomortierella wolfii]
MGSKRGGKREHHNNRGGSHRGGRSHGSSSSSPWSHSNSRGQFYSYDMDDADADFISLSGQSFHNNNYTNYSRSKKQGNQHQHNSKPSNYNGSSSNTESRRPAYTPSEELIYSRIQNAKARQQKRQQQILQQQQQLQPRVFRGPPPAPKQGANGKNSKHAFWPHPDNGKHGEVQRGKQRGLINIQFSRASALTDPTAREGYVHDEFDSGLVQDDDLERRYASENDDEDDSSDDILRREVDSDDTDEEFLMQQFNWIEEDQDPDRRKPAVPDTATGTGDTPTPQVAALLSSWGGALQYQTQTEGADINVRDLKNTDALTADAVTTLKHRQQSPQITATTATTAASTITTSASMLDARSVANELQNLSRPLSAMSQTSLKSLSHQDKKPKLGRGNNVTAKNPTFSKQGQPDGRCELSSRVEAMEITMDEPELAAGFNTSTVSNVRDDAGNTSEIRATLSTPKDKDGDVLAKEASPEPLMWVMDTNPSYVEEVIPDTYVTLPVDPEIPETDMFIKPKRKAHRSKRGGVKTREKLKAKQGLAARKDAGDDDGVIYLNDTGAHEEQDEEALALQDYLENTMDPDNPDHYESLAEALRGLHAGPGHSKDARAEGADDSDFEALLSEDDSQDEIDQDYLNSLYDDSDDDGDDDDEDDELENFDFEHEDENGNIHFKSSLMSSASGHQKDRRQNRKADQLLREEMMDNLLPLWQAGAIDDADTAFANRKGSRSTSNKNNSNRPRRAKGYDVVYDDSETVLPGYMARKHAKGKKERHDGSLETLTEINK